jgi:DNA-3-methyladenine glycosylase
MPRHGTRRRSVEEIRPLKRSSRSNKFDRSNRSILKGNMQANHHAPAAGSQVPNIRAVEHASDPFAGSTIEVARRLIGATLHRVVPPGERDGGAVLRGRIVETEAYLPLVDPACHGYRGPTRRNASIFGRRGTAYVYLIYGVHCCLNVVTEPAGIGGAVLVRAVEPVQGIAAMRARRSTGVKDEALASGPGNLCRAFAIDLRDDGTDLRSGALRITFDKTPSDAIAAAARVGLSSASAWPLRFYDPLSTSVSRRPRAQ